MAGQEKPNIVLIMADDVGTWNLSAHHRGMMGGSTPNVDRIAREGALFTDYPKLDGFHRPPRNAGGARNCGRWSPRSR